MKYIIERAIANDPREPWERSSFYNGVYTEAQAQAILDDNTLLRYRMTPFHDLFVSVKSKPYRRHAAITPLELRGAISMLESARRSVVQAVNSSSEGSWAFEAFTILTNAMLANRRALEAMEKN